MTAITSPAAAATTTATEGVVVRSAVKAGRLSLNHSEGVVVRSAVKAGALSLNHSESLVAPDPAPTTEPADEDAIVIEF